MSDSRVATPRPAPKRTRPFAQPDITTYSRDELATARVFTGIDPSAGVSDRAMKEHRLRSEPQRVLRQLAALL